MPPRESASGSEIREGEDGDESSGVSSDGAMKIRRANEGKHGDEWLELQTEGV